MQKLKKQTLYIKVNFSALQFLILFLISLNALSSVECNPLLSKKVQFQLNYRITKVSDRNKQVAKIFEEIAPKTKSAQQLGSLVKVELAAGHWDPFTKITNKNSETITGYLLHSLDAREFLILDIRTGQIRNIPYLNDVEKISFNLSNAPTKRLTSKGQDLIPKKETIKNIHEYFQKNPNQYVSFVYNHNSVFKDVLWGKIIIKEHSPNYNIFSLVDANGVTHNIDLKYIRDFEINVFKNKTIINQLDQTFALAARAEPFNLIDQTAISRKILIEDIMDEGKLFSNEKLYQFLAENKSAGEKLLHKWYGNKKFIKKAKEVLPWSHFALLLDPGIANRGEDFINFAQKKLVQSPNLSPWSLRVQYSKKLGNTKIIRAMVLTPKQAQHIKLKGLESPSFLDQKHLFDRLDTFLDNKNVPRSYGVDSPSYIVSTKLDNIDGHSLFISVSTPEYEAIAKSATYYSSQFNFFGKDKFGKDVFLYVFEMDVPELSLMRFNGPIFKPATVKFRKHTLFTDDPSSPNFGKNFKIGKHEGLEMWIPYKIPAEQILKIKKFDVSPIKYQFK